MTTRFAIQEVVDSLAHRPIELCRAAVGQHIKTNRNSTCLWAESGPGAGALRAPAAGRQTTPWSSIESATFMKPAMFAPFT